MPLFLPSDPDLFPTGELKKVEKAPEPKLEPKDDWKEVKPGIFQNGLGQKRTGDMRTKIEESPSNFTKITINIEGDTTTRDMTPYSKAHWDAWLTGWLNTYPGITWQFS